MGPAAGDGETVGNAAYDLQDTIINFGATAALAPTEDLQNQARTGDLTAAATTCARLESEWKHLAGALADFARDLDAEDVAPTTPNGETAIIGQAALNELQQL